MKTDFDENLNGRKNEFRQDKRLFERARLFGRTKRRSSEGPPRRSSIPSLCTVRCCAGEFLQEALAATIEELDGERWGGSFGTPRQLSPNCDVANLDAELEQFATDPTCAQSGLAEFVWRGRSRISPFVLGRPIRRDRHHH